LGHGEEVEWRKDETGPFVALKKEADLFAVLWIMRQASSRVFG
jgi:hypothetical protein